MKCVKDRYVNPVTVKVGSSDSDNSVNLPVKHQKIFAALKVFDPSISITINDTTINHPVEFPMCTMYTYTFDVITDKKLRFPRVLSIMNSNRKSKSPFSNTMNTTSCQLYSLSTLG